MITSGFLKVLFVWSPQLLVAGFFLRRSWRQRQLQNSDSLEADQDVLDALYDHWLITRNIDFHTAKQMKRELSEHIEMSRQNGVTISEVLGSNLAVFANDWADAYGPPKNRLSSAGPASFTIGVFVFISVCLLRAGQLLFAGKAIAWVAMVAMALVFGVSNGCMVPFVTRIHKRSKPWTMLEAFLAPLSVTIIAVLVVGFGIRELLAALEYPLESSGSWWTPLLVALTVAGASVFIVRRWEK